MVLLPGPMTPALNGPPTSFALAMRPWLLAVFILMLPVAGARFMVLDIIGGIFLILTACIGWFSTKGGMDISWLLCLSVVLFLNAIFDAFILLAKAVRMEKPLFGKTVPWHLNVVHGLLFAGPILEMIGAIMCWKIYKEHVSLMLPEESFENIYGQAYAERPPQNGSGYGAVEVSGRPAASPSANVAGAAARRPPQQQQSFEAFQGQGFRLSD